VLYLIGYFERPTRAPRRLNGRYALAAVRVEDGTILWQRSDVGPGTFLTADVLRMSSNAIPLATLVPGSVPSGISLSSAIGSQPETGHPTGRVEMSLLDKATGNEIGQPVNRLLPTGVRGTPILDVSIWAGEIIVRMTASELRFGVETPASRPAMEVRMR